MEIAAFISYEVGGCDYKVCLKAVQAIKRNSLFVQFVVFWSLSNTSTKRYRLLLHGPWNVCEVTLVARDRVSRDQVVALAKTGKV